MASELSLRGLVSPLLPQPHTVRRGVRTTSVQACGLYLAVAAPNLGYQGVIIGRERYSGRAMIYDPFIMYGESARVRLASPHMLVLGKSGHGKSAMTKCYVLRQLRYQDRAACVLDAQGEGETGEWTGIAEAMGVTPIRLSFGGLEDEAGVHINPLDPAMPTRHRHALLATMTAIVLGHELDANAEFALRVAVDAAIAKHGSASLLGDILTALTQPQPAMLGQRQCSVEELIRWGEPVSLALDRLVNGDLAGMFDQPTSEGVDWSSRLIVFDMSRLPREGPAMPLFMAVIGSWLQFGWINPRSTTKYTLVIEEAWHILSLPAVARLFNQLLRFGRRLGLSVIAVLHHLSDLNLEDVPEALSFIKLTASRVIYHVEGEDADTLGSYLQLPAWAIEAVKDAANLCAPGSAIWSLAGVTMLVEHLRSPTEIELTNTNRRMLEGSAQERVAASRRAGS